MKHLEIPNMPDELYERIERRAKVAGRSVAEQAAQILEAALTGDEAEAVLLEQIAADREALAKKAVFLSDSDVDAAIAWGRR